MTATSHVLPSGTVIVVSNVLVPELPDASPDTGDSSTPAPPSLPMISLVIANLNPRDLMQLARIRIEVVIPRDSVRNVHWFAYAGKESRTRIN